LLRLKAYHGPSVTEKEEEQEERTGGDVTATEVLTPLGSIVDFTRGGVGAQQTATKEKSFSVEGVTKDLVLSSKEMNQKMDEVEDSTGVEIEKRLELVTVMEIARDPLRQITERAIKVFPKNMTDFFDRICVKLIYQPSFGKSSSGYNLFKRSQNYHLN
jgi:hypothetical protein